MTPTVSSLRWRIASIRNLVAGGAMLCAGFAAWAQGSVTYTHDRLNRLTRTVLADGSSVDLVYDGAGNIVKTQRVSKQVRSSLDEDFDGTDLRSDRWTGYDNGQGYTWTVADGLVRFDRCTGANTRDKVELVGQRLVLTARFAGVRDDWDSHIEIVDAETGQTYVQVGDTNYGDPRSGGASFGMYLYVNSQIAALGGNATKAWKEYELVIDRDQVTYRRGDSLNNLSQVLTTTLPVSVEGKRYFVQIGTGCGYDPALFDWVRARAE